MKNSSLESGIFIDSDEDVENDQHKYLNDGNDSDCSNYSNERKPSNYNMAWPQSYRQSIDLYGSVPSPNIGFLGTTSLSRLGSSFISSSLTRRQTLEILQPEKKSLLQPTEEEQLRHTLLPSQLSRKSSIRKDPSKVSHEVHIPGQCTFGQAVLNGINALCGIGILSTPYAVKEGGWVGLSILLLYALFSYYTGLLLRYCLDSSPGLETYPDIGQAAFGTIGRVIISACCIEYIIVESDNLSTLFPNAHINLGGIEVNAHILFAILTALALLPTVWLRDLRILSYISDVVIEACGVIATVLVVVCLIWVCLVDKAAIDDSQGTTTLNLATFPVAMGLYGYCYAGHAVFPNLYTAMANRNQFPGVLLVWFGNVINWIFTHYVCCKCPQSLILPAACFLSIRGGRISSFQVALCVTIIIVGVVSSCFGSYSSLAEIIEKLFG
ncbi:Amino acid transporter [Vigna angularis]|uniref:Amino acid transporter n=1 Tax=Phaseolus angularis TaxID=3914 RepID=A0A8T0KV12_PHAAN|nr:Amino acid transporter [Vigna angularis]